MTFFFLPFEDTVWEASLPSHTHCTTCLPFLHYSYQILLLHATTYVGEEEAGEYMWHYSCCYWRLCDPSPVPSLDITIPHSLTRWFALLCLIVMLFIYAFFLYTLWHCLPTWEVGYVFLACVLPPFFLYSIY